MPTQQQLGTNLCDTLFISSRRTREQNVLISVKVFQDLFFVSDVRKPRYSIAMKLDAKYVIQYQERNVKKARCSDDHLWVCTTKLKRLKVYAPCELELISASSRGSVAGKIATI